MRQCQPFGGMAPLVGLGGEHAPGVGEAWKDLGKEITHWDQWMTNPAEAAGKAHSTSRRCSHPAVRRERPARAAGPQLTRPKLPPTQYDVKRGKAINIDPSLGWHWPLPHSARHSKLPRCPTG
jgi:hypothetical protein